MASWVKKSYFIHSICKYRNYDANVNPSGPWKLSAGKRSVGNSGFICSVDGCREKEKRRENSTKIPTQETMFMTPNTTFQKVCLIYFPVTVKEI